MKRNLSLTVTLLLFLTSFCMAQDITASGGPPAPPAQTQAKPVMSRAQVQRNIIASEKKLWEGWKNRDVKPFRVALWSTSIMVSEGGVAGRDELLKIIPVHNCEISTYTLSDFKLTWLSSDTAVLTYKGVQDGTCGGNKIPATVYASSVWIKRNGKWYVATHQETPAMP